jgi:hypothetical protein
MKISLPAEPSLVVKRGNKRMLPVTPHEVNELMTWEIEYRFVREVERLERSGVVPSRGELERVVGLFPGDIRAIRGGIRGVGLAQLALLHEKYRGDRDYILHGRRNEELSKPYIPGIGNIAKYEGFIHQYKAPARWRCGPRPELVFPLVPSDPNSERKAWHYPEDPDNKQWKPGRLRNISDLQREQQEREGAGAEPETPTTQEEA